MKKWPNLGPNDRPKYKISILRPVMLLKCYNFINASSEWVDKLNNEKYIICKLAKVGVMTAYDAKRAKMKSKMRVKKTKNHNF